MPEITYKIEINRDEDPMNPRIENDNIGKMICKHDKYSLGDEDLSMENNGDSWSKDFLFFMQQEHSVLENIDGDDKNVDDYFELEDTDFKTLEDWVEQNVTILPLSLYDHSGITMSYEEQGLADAKRGWDSGQVGYIYCENDEFDEKHGINQEYVNNQQEWANGRSLEQIRIDILQGDVETYDTYLTGDIFRIDVTEHDEDGDEVSQDSCSGFFGDKIENLEIELLDRPTGVVADQGFG
jgi:uncharacterized protein YbcC (UPF0753/DUF2309 family)